MKNSKLLSLASIAVFFLTACGTTDAPVTPSEAPKVEPVVDDTAPVTPDSEESDTCGATGLKVLIGKSIAVVQMPADKNVRIIGPNSQVTMDHRPERMNIYIDEEANITDIRCG